MVVVVVAEEEEAVAEVAATRDQARMKGWHLFGIAALFWAAIFLPGLGSTELKGEEGRRILPARTMLRSGEWIVPFSEGKPYSRKPPGINWAIAASFSLTKTQNEWTARLPSVLSVLAGTLVILGTSRRMLGDAGALVAALSFLACVAQVDKGRLAEIEPLYVGLTAIAIALWASLWQGESNRWLTWTVPWLFLGLAMLTKGPLHLLFVYGIICAVLRDARQLRQLVSPPHIAGILIMAGIFAPWAIANAKRSAALGPDQASSQTVWIQQLTERIDPRGIDWNSYFLVPIEGVLNLAPWIILPIVFWRKIGPWSRNEPGRTGSLIRGLKLGILITFLVVSFIPESRPRFTMPMMGAAAILNGWVAAQAWERHPDALKFWWRHANFGAALILGLALLVAPWVIPDAPRALGFAGGILIALGLLLLARKDNPLPRLAGATAANVAAAIFILVVDLGPVRVKSENVRPPGRILNEALPEGATLTIFKPGPQPFLFYIDAPYTIADHPSEIPADTAYILLRPEHRDRVLSRKSIVKNGDPETIREVEAKDGKRYQLLRITRM